MVATGSRRAALRMAGGNAASRPTNHFVQQFGGDSVGGVEISWGTTRTANATGGGPTARPASLANIAAPLFGVDAQGHVQNIRLNRSVG
jgi:hypothetical protein